MYKTQISKINQNAFESTIWVGDSLMGEFSLTMLLLPPNCGPSKIVGVNFLILNFLVFNDDYFWCMTWYLFLTKVL